MKPEDKVISERIVVLLHFEDKISYFKRFYAVMTD